MRRILFVLTLLLCGTTAPANEKDDAVYYMSHFIEQKEWDSIHRRLQRRGDFFYRRELQLRGITILDYERFRDMMPSAAADEAIEQLKSHIADFVVQSYGEETLAQIADFFRTPTGKRMLAIARENRLFEELARQTPRGGPVEKWKTYLSLEDRTRYSAFTNTEAGQVFVQQTWAVRRAIHHEIYSETHWAELPIDRPYLADIVATGGILKFPNRVARQSFLSELSTTNQ